MTDPDVDEKPPVLSTWNAWYALVAAFLILWVVLFYQFRSAFE